MRQLQVAGVANDAGEGIATWMIRPRDEITDTGGRRQIVGSRGCVQPFDIDGSSKPWRDREFGQRGPVGLDSHR